MVSVVAAAVVGVIIYMTSTSIPYFAISPTSDSTFGSINACLLKELPQRVGFAVSPRGNDVAGWNGDKLVTCRADTTVDSPVVTHIADATFDREGSLWMIANDPPQLLLRRGTTQTVIGNISATHMVGTATGIVTLDAAGELRAIQQDGSVSGLTHLPAETVAEVALSVSADGTRLAAIAPGRGFAIYDAKTLTTVRTEAPCTVGFVWWLAEGHRVIVECAPVGSLFLDLNVDTGDSVPVASRIRPHAALVGDSALWVESCDVLPCTATPP